jgi:hypothetical protein
VHKRYQDWFQRQYLSTPESQTLRCDLIRFIVGVIHPSNELLGSDIIPRWAVIGWLLTTCTSQVSFGNTSSTQGCQIFLDTIHIPKRGKIYKITTKLPNHHKIYQMAIIYVYQMGIKYTNILNSKALQNLPKWVLWV